MAVSQVTEEIVDYLPLLSKEQQEALLHVAQAMATSSLPKRPSDEEIIRRLNALESGEAESVSWEEVKRNARARLAAR